MPRRVLLSAALVVVAGTLLLLVPFLTAKREVTALTPAVPPLPPGSLVPANIKPGSELCIRDLPMSADGQVARVLTASGGRPGPALTVKADAPGYSATTNVRAGWNEGPLEIPIKPPAHSLRGSFCIRNAGKGEFAVMASGVGQKLAHPQPYLDTQALQQDVPLWFHKAKRASALSRTGALIDHAAVFSPLPVALIWLLLAAVLVGIPALLLLAFSRAVAAPVVSPRTATAPPLPGAARARRIWASPRSARARGFVTGLPVGVWIAAIALATTIYIYVWASRVTAFTPDETLYVALADWLPHHLPGGLFEFKIYERGTQRLETIVLAIGRYFFGSPDGFKFAHIVNIAGYASTTIPAYLMARGLDVRKTLSLVAAALIVAIPWTPSMTSVLTEPLAYTAFAWAVWGVWRAVVEPTAGRELLALGLVLLALLARTIFIVMLALLPVAVVLYEARFGSLRPRDLFRRHPVLVVASVFGVLFLIAGKAGLVIPVETLTGQYGTSFALPFKQILNQDAFWGSRAVTGLGFVPFAAGGAWIVTNAFRPRDPRAFAFAVIGVLSTLFLIYASKPIKNVPTYVDERYMIYLAPLLLVACVAAFQRRDLWIPSVVIAGLFGAWLVRHEAWNPAGDPTEFFAAPAEAFYARVGLLRLQQYVPSWMDLRDAAFLLFAAATGVVAYAVSRRRGAAVVQPLVIAVLLVVQVAQANYAVEKHVNGGGGRYWSTLDRRAWVDRYLDGKKGDAGLLEAGVGRRAEYDYVWKGIQFWNTRVTSEWDVDELPGPTFTVGDRRVIGTLDEATGRVEPEMPAWMVVPRDYVNWQPAGDRPLRPEFTGQDLLRVSDRHQASWRVYGAGDESRIAQGAKVKIRFWARGQLPGQACAQVPLASAPAANGRNKAVRYRLGSVHGVIPPATQITVELPLDFHGRPYLDAPLELRGNVLAADGSTYAARILAITTGPCGSG